VSNPRSISEPKMCVVCEQSSDPVGVELAGVAKNAAALAADATEAQGLNAAGAAAGHIFLDVWRFAARQGARPESMIGLAGTGDLVATTLAPQSRNRRAGELLAQGVPAGEIPERIGQAVEALDMVPLRARALEHASIEAPVTGALNRLIAGELPLDAWVARCARPSRRPPGSTAAPPGGAGGGGCGRACGGGRDPGGGAVRPRRGPRPPCGRSAGPSWTRRTRSNP
jgi:glycerol-3-phosphate dehydrogenase (NAD(P)+)